MFLKQPTAIKIWSINYHNWKRLSPTDPFTWQSFGQDGTMTGVVKATARWISKHSRTLSLIFCSNQTHPLIIICSSAELILVLWPVPKEMTMEKVQWLPATTGTHRCLSLVCLTKNFMSFLTVWLIGNYTDKYWKTRELSAKLQKERGLPKIHIPEPPKIEAAVAYGDIKVKDYLSFEDLLTKIKPNVSNEAKHMEQFDQNFGFILYRISHKKFKHLKLPSKLFNFQNITVI